MIGDQVNAVMSRRPEAYAVSSFCEDCGQLKPIARLVQAFARPINICRDCRQARTGVEDRRGLGPRTSITVTIAEPQQLAPVHVAGLLTAGNVLTSGDSTP